MWCRADVFQLEQWYCKSWWNTVWFCRVILAQLPASGTCSPLHCAWASCRSFRKLDQSHLCQILHHLLPSHHPGCLLPGLGLLFVSISCTYWLDLLSSVGGDVLWLLVRALLPVVRGLLILHELVRRCLMEMRLGSVYWRKEEALPKW